MFPYQNITPIPNTEPDAIPALWNSRYQEIDANFAAVAETMDLMAATFVTSGDAPNFVLQPVPAPTALAPYLRFKVQFHANGVGDSSIDIGLGSATALKQYDSTGGKIAASIAAGQCCDIEYDGVDFVVLNPLPTAQNNTGDANALIAQHEAKKNPHPQYVPFWESGQAYVTGDIRHSKQDGRLFRSKVNFSSDILPGDPLFDYVTLLTDVQSLHSGDVIRAINKLTELPIETVGDVSFPGVIADNGRGLMNISNDNYFSFPKEIAQIGVGNFCLEIYEKDAQPTQEKALIFNCGLFKVAVSDSLIEFYIGGSETQRVSFNSNFSGGGRYIKIYRHNGFFGWTVQCDGSGAMTSGVLFSAHDFSGNNMVANFSPAENPTIGSGYVNLTPSIIPLSSAIRMYGYATSLAVRLTVGNPIPRDDADIDAPWYSHAPLNGIGPSTIDPAVDPDNWELMYGEPAVDVSGAVADAVANAVPPAVADAVNALQHLAAWVSGRQYAQGDIRFSPLDFGVYRCSAATSGAVDPSFDFSHWEPVSSGTPVGAVQDFDLSVAPPGWLELNGGAIPISDFPRLNNVKYCGDANNETAEFWYHCSDPGNPSGSRTPAGHYLVLRDTRGLFRRSWDHGRGIDAGRQLGSYQADANREHSHPVTDPGHSHFTNKVATRNMSADDLSIFIEYTDISNNPIQKYTEEEITGITVDISGEPDGRPKNWAVLTCIKY